MKHSRAEFKWIKVTLMAAIIWNSVDLIGLEAEIDKIKMVVNLSLEKAVDQTQKRKYLDVSR